MAGCVQLLQRPVNRASISNKEISDWLAETEKRFS